MPSLSSVIATRSQRADVKSALMGGLLTLDDTQVRDRPGRGPSRVDSCDSQDGYRSTFQLNLPLLPRPLDLPSLVPIGNRHGEWATEVHVKPLQWFSDKAVSTPSDSNAFVPAAIAYPLFIFQEDRLEQGSPVVEDMRQQALDNVRGYRSPEGGYNFWPRWPDGPGVKPLNLPLELIEWPLTRSILIKTGLGPGEWIERVMDPGQNPQASLALTNIPDDADDTAIAVAAQELERRAGRGAGDASSLQRLPLYRDLHRTAPRGPGEEWQGSDTGAYLTWLSPEQSNPFTDPAHGVLPLGQNDVGPVVNANAVLALSLCGQSDAPGYKEAVHLLVRTIEERRWQEGTRYYPQPAVFPYCVTRAWRDGQVHDPQLDQAMHTLLKDVLGQQSQDGSFPGGRQDQSRALSTAMSVVALLNLGRPMAEQEGMGQAYDKAIEAGVSYLIGSGQACPLRYDDTFQRGEAGQTEAALSREGRTWEPGIFFSGSPFGGYWRSEAYTVGVVVEALAKYVTATELGGPQRKIHPLRYATSAEQASSDFQFVVE